MTEQQFTTRQEILSEIFSGLKDPDKELDLTLEAIGLKAGGKKFKVETAHYISIARDWINSGEIEDYGALAARWTERQAQVKEGYLNAPNGLTTTDGGDLASGSNPEDLFNSLREPAQQSFNAGRELMVQASSRTQHNQQLVSQVLDASFFEGVKAGAGEVGGVKKFAAPPLMTPGQAEGIIKKIVKDSQQQNS